jgi:hypothetical protein
MPRRTTKVRHPVKATQLQRHVVARKDQMLVALPAEVRRHLSLAKGAQVWWHITRKGDVSLTASPRGPSGRPSPAQVCESCGRYRAEIERVQRKLSEQEPAARRRAWFEMAQQKLRLELTGLPVMGALNDRLRRIEEQLARLVGRAPYMRSQRAHPVRKVERAPAPVLSSPSEAGGADTSGGEAPQVSHSESLVQAP